MGGPWSGIWSSPADHETLLLIWTLTAIQVCHDIRQCCMQRPLARLHAGLCTAAASTAYGIYTKAGQLMYNDVTVSVNGCTDALGCSSWSQLLTSSLTEPPLPTISTTKPHIRYNQAAHHVRPTMKLACPHRIVCIKEGCILHLILPSLQPPVVAHIEVCCGVAEPARAAERLLE